MKKIRSSILYSGVFTAVSLSICASAFGADIACVPLMKAVEKGMALPQIHSATVFERSGEKKLAIDHSIVIGDEQYLIEGGRFRGPISLNNKRLPPGMPSMRPLATNLAQFQIEEGCKALGKDTVVGRAAIVIGIGYEVAGGEAMGKAWIDTATGLPLRVITRQPDTDTKFLFDKKTKKMDTQTTENGKTITQTHVYLFGDIVKVPGPKGAIEPSTITTLEAMLK